MIAKPQTALMNSLMHKSIPFVVAALFLISTGGGIRNKAYTAVAPPIYDPIAYYHKSRVVWDALSKGNFAGTLNGVKANRPPATALLLYPFGFTNSVTLEFCRVCTGSNCGPLDQGSAAHNSGFLLDIPKPLFLRRFIALEISWRYSVFPVSWWRAGCQRKWSYLSIGLGTSQASIG